MPMLKIPLSAIFFLVAICRRQRIGMGRTMTVISWKRFKMAMYRSRVCWSPQELLIVKSHVDDIGWQMRQSARMMLVKKSRLSARALKHMMRKRRGGKRWMYKKMIEARIVVTARPQRIVDRNASYSFHRQTAI